MTDVEKGKAFSERFPNSGYVAFGLDIGDGTVCLDGHFTVEELTYIIELKGK